MPSSPNPHAELIAKMAEKMPKEKDHCIVSMSPEDMEKSGFNACRSEVLAALPKMLDTILEGKVILEREDVIRFISNMRLMAKDYTNEWEGISGATTILKNDIEILEQALRSNGER